MPDYTDYTAVILALVELRAQVADDITHTHLSAAPLKTYRQCGSTQQPIIPQAVEALERRRQVV